MNLFSTIPGVLALAMMAQSVPTSAATVSGGTLSFSNLVTGGGSLARVYTPFSFAKFDTSLGSLSSVDIAFNFSGTVGGTAIGVSESSSFNDTVDHLVFFDFVDTTHNVMIVQPTLRITETIPAEAQNATIVFGPEFRTSSLAFSVGENDARFNAWRNGPGEVSGRLGVFFNNTAQNAFGLQFFAGTDTGLYDGWLSIAYTYTPVPEPSSIALVGVAVGSLFLWARHRCPVFLRRRGSRGLALCGRSVQS